MNKIYDMLIIGGGPGGYTAALYAARAGLSVALLEKLSAGGQMALTSEIDNYPGFPKGVDGFELGLQMKEGAERFGAETVLAEVFSLRLEEEIKEAHTSEGLFRGRTVVFATGANPKTLGVPGEERLTGKGLHYCAHCDGMFYRNKTVMVVGGGNTAAADALLLSRIAKKVTVVHRRETLRATKIYHEPLIRAENVEFLWNSSVTALISDDRVRGAVVRGLRSGEEREVAVDGIFVSIGRAPATALVAGQLELDEGGYVVAGENTQTNLPGVFAVGDVRAKALRQIVTAVSDGAIAAHFADEYLAENGQ